ncbi:MAG: O-antigen ligase family protein [Candidatus Moranbacteria bacterium]|nr:O-antigen ligase family protein [Candidatus Moranbacteria bacterium]
MVNFENLFKNIKNILKRELVILWIFSVLLGLALIVLGNKSKLPLQEGDFVFLSLLTLLIALYRPRWVFFVFVGLVPLENIILVSGFIPLQLRPYQFVGAILAAALIILWFFKKLKFELLRPNWIDWLIFSLAPLSFLALVNAPDKNVSLKQNTVLLSFIILYYLTRNFVRNKKDLLKIAFFFAGSWLVVMTYGFYQVFADKFGKNSFEVMFGRPNSTFAEPDWLGIFLCFALAALLSVNLFEVSPRIKIIYIFLFFNITLLILTLSRSAWIGGAIILLFFSFFSLFKKKEKVVLNNGKIWTVIIIFTIVFLSLIAVRAGKLSKFDLSDRARSTATNEQKITIACEKNIDLPKIVANIDELTKFNCRHINLEEIYFYKSQGKFVFEIYRKDPNVMTRSTIYRKSWEIIREHPILGVGFGTITQNLGIDERGAGLNESNIFLQVWTGSGILGLVAFIILIGYLFIYAFRRASPVCPLNKIIGCPIVKSDFEKTLNVFVVLVILALIVPNLFNAGLLMGLLWLGLAVVVSTQKIYSH